MHPVDNMPNYGADICQRSGEAGLRLLFHDIANTTAGQMAVIMYLQNGIDLYGTVTGGVLYKANGGHDSGRKLPLSFAAVLLNDTDMQTAVSKAPYNTFQEDGSIFRGKDGRPLFGEPCDEHSYWLAIYAQPSGDKACRDPYGYIDGGPTPGGEYQFCCNSMPWKAAAAVLSVFPQVQTVWNYPPYLEYLKRWVTAGTISLPDPCAPYDGNASNYGKTWGPAGDGDCVKGKSRFPEANGTSKNSGYYGTKFIDLMYAALV